MEPDKLQALSNAHRKAQTQRRELETEWAGIDAALERAINGGDAPLIIALNKRKQALPDEVITASSLEESAAQAYHHANHQVEQLRAETAQAALLELELALATRQIEVERELDVMKGDIARQQARVNQYANEAKTWQLRRARSSGGYKKALQTLTA